MAVGNAEIYKLVNNIALRSYVLLAEEEQNFLNSTGMYSQ